MLLQEEYIFRLLKRKEERVFGENGPSSSHITNEIKDRMQLLGKSGDYDVITEIGGTVGDIEFTLYRISSSTGMGYG
jgi:CTP synthase